MSEQYITRTREEIKAAANLVLSEVPLAQLEYARDLYAQLDGGPEAKVPGCIMSAQDVFFSFERDEVDAEIKRRGN